MFSENQKISERQMARLLIFDMCGISTLLLPGLLGKMLGTDGVFAILLGAVPVYLFTFLPELLQEKRKNSNTRNGSNTSNISNIGKSYPEILKKQGNGFIRIFVLVVYTVEGILLAGYGLFLLSDLMVSELLKDSSFVLAAVLLMLLCGYGIWQGIEGRARVYEILFWFVFLPLVLMLLLATKDVNTIYWTPVMVHSWGNFVKGTAAVVLLYGTMAFVLFLQPYLAENVRVGRTCRKSLSLEDAESVTLSNLCCSYAFTEQNGQVTETVTIKADGKYQGNRELLQKTKHRDEKLEDLHTDSQDENALLEVEAEIEQTLEEKMDAMTEKLQQNQNADGTNSYYKLGAYARDIYLQFQKDWSGYRKNLTVEYHWDVTLVTSP